MNTDNLIIELKKYLEQKNISYYTDSFNFKGLRKDVPQPDGGTRALYVVSYMASTSDNEFDSDVIFYAYFDKKTKQLSYIIGPQSYEKIEE